MNDLTLATWDQVVYFLLLVGSVIFSTYLIVKRKLTGSRFYRFLGILLIGISCSMVPMGLFGVIVGFPSVFLASVLVSCFLDNEKQIKKGKR